MTQKALSETRAAVRGPAVPCCPTVPLKWGIWSLGRRQSLPIPDQHWGLELGKSSNDFQSGWDFQLPRLTKGSKVQSTRPHTSWFSLGWIGIGLAIWEYFIYTRAGGMNSCRKGAFSRGGPLQNVFWGRPHFFQIRANVLVCMAAWRHHCHSIVGI